MKRFAYLAYGIICYAVFGAAFLYAIGFVGNWVVPRSIDRGPDVPLLQAIIIDLILIALFGLSHSLMARQSFKKRWTAIVPQPLERSTYVLVASLFLLLMFLEWQPIEAVIWDFRQTALNAILWILFAFGWGFALLSTFLINHFDLFGLRQVYLYFRGRDYQPIPFVARSLYRFIRHPLMLGLLIAFWAIPLMSAGHLLFTIGMTVYILVGVAYEERDLLRFYGTLYATYRQQVSMLFPLPRRK